MRPVRGAHAWQGRLHQGVIRQQMFAEGVEESLLAGAMRGATGRARGVVDQDVDGMDGDQRVDRGAQADRIGHVRHYRVVALRADARQGIDHRLQCVGAARQHGDVGAEQRQFVRGGAADAFGGAADQRVFAVEVQIHGVLSCQRQSSRPASLARMSRATARAPASSRTARSSCTARRLAGG